MEALHKNKAVWLGALGGVLLHTSAISLYQDVLGKDSYIELVKNNWAPAVYTVPLAILVFIAGALCIARGVVLTHKQERMNEWHIKVVKTARGEHVN